MKRTRSYVKAMLHALDRCKTGYGAMESVSRTDALRCIKEFEQTNRCQFDPHNSYHVEIVSGMAPFSRTIRKVGKALGRKAA